MTKTLDLIKRFDRQVYYNTEPFKRALTDNPSAKSFAINNQGIISVAIETANHVIEAHRNDINSLYALVLNLNK